MFGLFYCYGDGCTYWGESFLGIFGSEEEATAAYVTLAKDPDFQEDENHSFEVRPIELGKIYK